MSVSYFGREWLILIEHVEEREYGKHPRITWEKKRKREEKEKLVNVGANAVP